MNIELMRESQMRCKKRAYERQILGFKERGAYRENLNLIRSSNRCGSHMNCFRFSLGESREHILKKLDICIELMNKNHKFMTEGIFLNGFRCDVIDLSDGIIYEIMNSEDDKKFNEKVKRYPGLKIVKVRIVD